MSSCVCVELFTDWVAAVGNMRGLTYLDVSSNELTKLPADLGKLVG